MHSPTGVAAVFDAAVLYKKRQYARSRALLWWFCLPLSYDDRMNLIVICMLAKKNPGITAGVMGDET